MNRRKFLAFFSTAMGADALSQSNGLQSWAKNLTPSLPFKPVLGPMPLLTSQIDPLQQAQRFKDYAIADDLILPEGYAYQVLGAWGDRNGQTFESIGLRPEQIMVLHFEPASPDLKPEMVTG
jgi:uncharacterized protein